VKADLIYRPWNIYGLFQTPQVLQGASLISQSHNEIPRGDRGDATVLDGIFEVFARLTNARSA
jgi:hypothetical protein